MITRTRHEGSMTTIDEEIAAAGERWEAGWRAGPSRLGWETLPVQLGDAAPDAEMPDHEGRPVRLADTWSGDPALILFWRHFGCSCGMDRARRLKDELATYREAGASVLIVGQAEPERAARY